MQNEKYPMTAAIRQLQGLKINFEPYEYNYEEKGGTRQTALELNIDEHSVVKTLIFEDESGKAMIVLMHGDCEVSTKELARTVGVKTIAPCSADKANKLTGYQFGGTSPFGTRSSLPVYCESSISDLNRIYINGGKRGFIISITPESLFEVFDLELVKVAIKK